VSLSTRTASTRSPSSWKPFAQWKRLDVSDHERMLADAWAFKEFVFAIPIHAAQAQREALLHLVHPDSFESIVSQDAKKKIDAAFPSHVTEWSDDIDQRLLQIRDGLTHELGHPFGFWDEDIKAQWMPATSAKQAARELLARFQLRPPGLAKGTYEREASRPHVPHTSLLLHLDGEGARSPHGHHRTARRPHRRTDPSWVHPTHPRHRAAHPQCARVSLRIGTNAHCQLSEPRISPPPTQARPSFQCTD
jgi:hypothetical protein